MVVGQILGGVLVAADIAGTGWRSVFLVNVPVVVVGLFLAVRGVPETRSQHPEPVDGPGTVLLDGVPPRAAGPAHRGPLGGLAAVDVAVAGRRSRS